MKFASVIALALCLHAAPAMAFPFSFNRADAATMVQGCKDDGITLSPTLAQAIVDYRAAHGPFADGAALMAVPGMSALMFRQLQPQNEEGDVRFNLSGVPGMRSY